MKKILVLLSLVVLSTAVLSNENAPKNTLADEAAKKAYILTNDVKGEYQTIPLTEVKRMLDNKEATLLDVRNPDELVTDGYIAGAVFIPLPELEKRLGELDKNKPYITFCAVGGRSAKAAALLSSNGFTKIFNAKEGIKAWPYDKVKK